MDTAPGPKGHYLHGSQLEFEADPLGFLRASARRFGDFVRFRLGLRESFLVSNLDEIRRLLSLREGITDRRAGPRLATYAGGLSRIEGEAHLARRRLLEPAFRSGSDGRHAIAARAITEAAVAGWVNGQVVEVVPALAQIALDTLIVSLLGDEGRSRCREIAEAAAVIEVWLAGDPTMDEERFRVADSSLRRALRGAAAERAARGSGSPPDVLGLLVTALAEGRIDEAALVDEVMLMLITRQPLAATLAWALFHLASAPALRDAVESALDPAAPSPPPLVDAVVRETLRLHPPVWTLARETRVELAIAGRRVPADRDLLLSPYVVQRSPSHHEAPDEFRPERFAAGCPLHRARHRLAWFPFGAGVRKCLGQPLATVLLVEIVAAVCRRVRLSVPGGYQAEPGGTAALRPAGGLPMRVTLR